MMTLGYTNNVNFKLTFYFGDKFERQRVCDMP